MRREKSGTQPNVDSTSERAGGPKRRGAAADWTREGTVGFKRAELRRGEPGDPDEVGVGSAGLSETESRTVKG